jgi:hypothetical protein
MGKPWVNQITRRFTQGLRKVYAWFTLAKLIWGRGQIAPDPFLRKPSLRMVYAWFTHGLRKVYAR